jgi:hypothetical protein
MELEIAMAPIVLPEALQIRDIRITAKLEYRQLIISQTES